MTVQSIRLANLRALVRKLVKEGLATREAQAEFLGNAASAYGLQKMLDGGAIPLLFAEHVEHVMFKPRGWMSENHEVIGNASAGRAPASDPPD
jgi:hypothetical protein